MLRKSLFLTATALTVSFVTAAQAQQRMPNSQQICAPRAQLVEKLKAEFKEEPQAIGVTHSGGLFEILSSESGTWTVLATGPNGVSCLVLSGDGWMSKMDRDNSTKVEGKRNL
ncbi:MAG: hypothetical protein FJX54_16250 [Alphaproteobacteria bacterium]|nr:hypothetical protein [Alphaproteobacteria bacterium]